LVTSFLNPAAFGATVTFTATVSSPAGAVPIGSVTFKDGTTTLGVGILSSGNATFSTKTLAVGSHSITASYAGTANFLASGSSTLNEVIKAATSTTLASSLNPSHFGQTVTFTATVTSTHAGTIAGTVTFKHGLTTIGTSSVTLGKATLVISNLAVGANSITASYGGDSTYLGSVSVPLSQAVSQAMTQVVLTSSLNPSSFGQAVTFTATVKPQFSGTPTGTVTFEDNELNPVTVALVGGTAKLTRSTLARGSHPMTAEYNGSVASLSVIRPC
jgi:hypothetical protein